MFLLAQAAPIDPFVQLATNADKVGIGAIAIGLLYLLVIIIRGREKKEGDETAESVAQSAERKSYLEMFGKMNENTLSMSLNLRVTAELQNANTVALKELSSTLHTDFTVLEKSLIEVTTLTREVLPAVTASVTQVVGDKQQEFIESFTALLDKSIPKPEAFVTLDIDGNVLFINEYFSILTGVPLEDVQALFGKNLEKSLSTTKDGVVLPSLATPFEMARGTRESMVQIIGVYNPSKQDWVWLLCRADPIFRADSPAIVDRILLRLSAVGQLTHTTKRESAA